MRKIFIGTIVGIILTTIIVPVIGSAQIKIPEIPTGCTIKHTFKYGGIDCVKDTTVSFDSKATKEAICCTLDPIFTAFDWVFIFAIVVAIMFIVLGGFMLMTAGGEPEKLTKGKSWVIWALIGFAVAIAAKALPAIVTAFAGLK